MTGQLKIGATTLAPPLTDSKLERYTFLVNGLPIGPLRDGLLKCVAAVTAWWELPESSGASDLSWRVVQKGVEKTIKEVKLHPDQVEALDPLIPWMDELNMLSGFTTEAGAYVPGQLDSLPAGELREAAYHLVWFVKHLYLDREPPTTDKLI